MDDRHVVIGYVIGEQGLRIVEQMNALGTESGKPSRRVTCLDCGQIYP